MNRTRQIARGAYGALTVLAMMGGLLSSGAAQMRGYNGNNQSQGVWTRMDACKRAAWKAHPDYTREGSAQRDKAVKRCLEASGLPPVQPPRPDPNSPQERSGASR